MKVVIVGDGAVGISCARKLCRERDSNPQLHSLQIVMVSDDKNPTYFRAALTNYLLGELEDRQLDAVSLDFFERNNIQRIYGRVVSIQSQKKSIVIQTHSKGKQTQNLSYDKLVLGIGTRPRIPLDAGQKKIAPWTQFDGVMTLRTLHEAKCIQEKMEEGHIKKAIIVGGGPLAMEWVSVFHRKGIRVSLLLRSKESLMRGVLSPKARDLLLFKLQEQIDVLYGEIQSADILGGTGIKQICRVQIASKNTNTNKTSSVACDFVGLAIGVVPSTHWITPEMGIQLQQGYILVKSNGETSVSDIFAGGDVAQLHSSQQKPLGLWGPAQKQGHAIASNCIYGHDKNLFPQEPHYFATRLFDMDCSFGGVLDSPNPERSEIIEWMSPVEGSRAYQRFVFQDNRLIGFLCMGDIRDGIRKKSRLYHKIMSVTDNKFWKDFFEIRHQFFLSHYPLARWMSSYFNVGEDSELTPKQLSQSTKNTSDSERDNIPFLTLTSETSKLKQQISGRCRIGKSQQADMTLHSKNSKCSQNMRDIQAEIFWDGRRYILDVASLGDVFVNQKAIKGKNQIPLRKNDAIQFYHRDTAWLVDIFFPKRVHPSTTFLYSKASSNIPNSSSNTTIFGLGIKTRLANTVQRAFQIFITHQDNHKIPLDKEWQFLGRDPKATISVQHKTISFQHVEFLWGDSHLYIRDMGSTNGTFWNEEQVTLPQKITSAGILRCGDVEFPIDVHKGNVFEEEAKHSNNKTLETEPYYVPPKKQPETEAAEATETPTLYELRYLGKRAFLLEGVAYTIGREAHNKIVVTDTSVSASHALLFGENGKWYFEDLKSTNGSFINDKKLPKSQKIAIPIGVEIVLGTTPVYFGYATEVPKEKRKILVYSRSAGSPLWMQKGQSYKLGREIGKADWVLKESSVSVHHAELKLDSEGKPWIRDLGSSNGTFYLSQRVGDEFVEVDFSQEIFLGSKCTIRIEEERYDF